MTQAQVQQGYCWRCHLACVMLRSWLVRHARSAAQTESQFPFTCPARAHRVCVGGLGEWLVAADTYVTCISHLSLPPSATAQVMHDEAVTTWTDQINQMTVGHRFILDNFGVVPTKGWQIDPFGMTQRSIAHCRPLALATLHVSLELTVHHCHHVTGSSAATPTLFARMGNSATTSSKYPSTICHSHSTPKHSMHNRV